MNNFTGTSTWLDDVIVWCNPETKECYIGQPWADIDPTQRLPYQIDIKLWKEEGHPVPRCEARQIDKFYLCALWPEHDGPHIPMTKELDLETGGLTIVGMRSI